MPAAKPSLPRLLRSKSLSQGLVGAWPLYEGSGLTANDVTGQQNDGTLTSDVSWSNGQSGYCLSFPGNSANGLGVVTCGANPSLNLSTAVSLVATFKAVSGTGDTTWQQIAGKGSVFVTASCFLLVYNGNDLRFYIRTGGAFKFVSWVGAGKGSWITAVGTYDGATQAIYGNGVLQASAAQTGTIDSNPTTIFALGRGGNINFISSDRFGGLIDSVAVYNRALSASEVAAISADPFRMYRTSRTVLKAGAAVTAQIWPYLDTGLCGSFCDMGMGGL